MAAKDITQLAPADSFDEGDLLLIRKTGAGADRNINYNKFIDSISSLGVHGFNARGSEGEENKITVTTSNGIVFSRYYDGMKIFFFAPTDSDNPQIRVGNLPYKDILKYDSEDYVTLKKSRYIEAIYIGDSDSGKFFQTNEYIIPANIDTTHQEPDHLAPLPLPAPTPIPMPLPPLVPLPDDIWDTNYGGNPDDPANAENPDSLDSRGNRIFDAKVLKVGNGGDFASITDAIKDLTKRLGVNGDGKNHAILILNDYDQEKFRQNALSAIDDHGHSYQSDISWISIFSENNKVVTFTPSRGGTSSIILDSKKNPILNFKMRRTGRDSDHINCFFLFRDHTEVIFGRNAEIDFQTPDVGKGSGIIWSWKWGSGQNITITAKYGLKIISPHKLLYDVDHYKLLLNKVVFEHTGKEGFIIDNHQDTSNYSVEMYNSEIKFKHKNDNTNFGAFRLKAKLNNNNTVYMRNVKCNDRSGKMIGIITNNSTAKLENCNFAAPQGTSGYDIMVDGDTGNNTITLKGTKGTTNQPKNTATAKGNILATPQNAVVNVTVGTNGQYPSINAAIEGLEAEFPDGVTDCKATIKLLRGHIIKEQITIINKDLSWITFISEDEEVKLDISYINKYHSSGHGCNFLLVLGGASPNINLQLVRAGSSDTVISFSRLILLKDTKIALNNFKFKGFFCHEVISSTSSIINAKNVVFEGVRPSYDPSNSYAPTRGLIAINSQINIEGGSLKGFGEGLYIEGGQHTINNFFISNIQGRAVYTLAKNIYSDEIKINFNNLNISNCGTSLCLNQGYIELNNCNFSNDHQIEAIGVRSLSITSCKLQKSGIYGVESGNINIVDSIISDGYARFEKCHNVLLTKCKVTPPPSTDPKDRISSISAYDSTNMIIDGGDYRNANNQSTEYNIYVGGSYGHGEYQNPSTIRLINNPLGGSIAHHGGKIIKG